MFRKNEPDKVEMCSVGKESASECHKKSYTQEVKLNHMSSFCDSEKDLLSLRSGVSSNLLLTVCEHHKIYFLKKYEIYQRSCCDPFNCHKKKVTRCLRKISLEFSLKINNRSIGEKKCIPGQKICNACREKVNKYLKSLTDIDYTEEQDSDSDQSISELEASVSKEKTLEEINTSLIAIGESPIKFHSVGSHSRLKYAKRKIDSAYYSLKEKVSKVLEQDFPTESDPKVIPKDVIKKADDLDRLVELIKAKLATGINQREKIQILTLAPASWSKKKIKDEFHVSDYLVRKSRDLLREKGILALPEPRKGKPLNQNVIQQVTEFYQSDEYSRIMPGSKDKVSVSKNVYAQKRLLLANLNELYAAFKYEHPDSKIGFSKFCFLRPKWCVLAGSPGSHSVCVCAIHQNVQLLLHACNIEDSYKDLIDHLVCSKESRDCMLRHCSKCPSSEALKSYLINKFDEWDPEDEITYSSWVSTDRTQQVNITVTLDEYLRVLVNSLETLVPHSFIAKSQAAYLKNLKTYLKPDEAIVLLDFSENYSYVIQDEVQGYHWTRNSCSVHPAVVYIRNDPSEDINVSSLCILSDDLEHDVAFVYETQKIITNLIKEEFATVKKVHYFSDGCAAQYKNCKNFINLCHHEKDFCLAATWSFFATSHGKSPCDGIGGTVKRLIAKESLQRRPGDLIDSVEKVFHFCTSRIEKIKFWLVKSRTLAETRQSLYDRFSKAKTVPGTRSFHQFIPQSETVISTKRISSDENFSTVFNFSGKQVPAIAMSRICTNSYIACVYDSHWFFGLVLSKHEDEGDVRVKFMHPYGPAPSFHWPFEKEDICYVPVTNIISCVSTPTTRGTRGVYYFTEKEIDYIQQQYMALFNKIR